MPDHSVVNRYEAMLAKQWFRKACGFYFHPVSYIDASWLHSSLNQTMINELSSDKNASDKLNKMIFEEFSIHPSEDFEIFKDNFLQLLLAHRSVWYPLIAFVGCLVHKSTIKRMIDKSSRTHLDELIGGTWHQRIKHASVTGNSHLSVANESFLHNVIHVRPLDVFDRMAFYQSIEKSGCDVLAIAFHGVSEACLQRFFLKLNRSWSSTIKNAMTSSTLLSEDRVLGGVVCDGIVLDDLVHEARSMILTVFNQHLYTEAPQPWSMH